MMKKMRKIVSALLAMVMVLAMGITASAAKITINNDNTSGQQETDATVYTYYKIMDAEISTNATVDPATGTSTAGVASYYVDSLAKATALTDTGLFTVAQMTDGRWNVRLTNPAATTGAQIAETLKNAVDAGTFGSGTTFTSNGTTATSGDVDPGYYYIKSSLGTVLAVQTLSEVTINEKNDYPTIDKQIVDGGDVDSNTANIGDTINYKVTIKVPESVAEKDMVITDTIYKGLTLKTDSLVYTSEVDTLTPAFVAGSAVGDDKVYTITIPGANVLANKGKTITLTYSAVLNADAIIAGTGNINKAHLAYADYLTKDEAVTTYTYKVEIDKREETKTGSKLAGVEFTLTNGAGKYFVTKSGDSSVWQDAENKFTTDDANNLVFEGLAPGTYTLTEVATVTGYNKLAQPITIEITDDGVVTYSSTDADNMASDQAADITGGKNAITIVNKKGATLPSTGGIGTTIFYVAGTILLLGAAVLLVVRRRMRTEC